jgi:hypothetical protein
MYTLRESIEAGVYVEPVVQVTPVSVPKELLKTCDKL